MAKALRSFLVLFLMVAAGAAAAQGYPNKPIRVIVPFQAGSAPDQVIRVTTQRMQTTLGQPFVIENKPGANGNIGVAEAARAAPDGYTLVSANNTTFAANPSLFKTLPFDPQKDFTPVARFITTGLILAVRSDFPAKDLKEFVALAKANPGKLTAAQASAGMRVSIAMLRSLAGVEVLEVPYKGQPQALQDVLGGQVSFTFADYAVGFPQIKAGKIRGLGVTTPKRSPVAPDIPTLHEGIPGFDVTVWAGMAAPAGTQPDVVAALWRAADQALASPDVRQALQAIGFGVEPLDPKAFSAYIAAETVRWAKMVKEAGIEPE
ncbi:MAG TPA: tripartite tricarboxylate transporter substrate binding protein [Burkholderiales bacterium]|nr:tripartite tricarboxylate transporter substrate binding protein [Burkholderiales bacterium]